MARVRGAVAQNRPIRQVMRDDLLVAIAKRQPTSRRDLEALRDFNRPDLLSRSNEVLAAIDEARSTPDDRPARARRAPRRRARGVDGRQPARRRAGPVLPGEQGGRLAGRPTRPTSSTWSAGASTAAPRPIAPALIEGWRGEVCGGPAARRPRRPPGPADRRPDQRGPCRAGADPKPRRPPDRCRASSAASPTATAPTGSGPPWTEIREAGIDHLELALRGHNFGGLVIPEEAVVTEKADDATAAAFVDQLAGSASRSAAATSAAATCGPRRASP